MQCTFFSCLVNEELDYTLRTNHFHFRTGSYFWITLYNTNKYKFNAIQYHNILYNKYNKNKQNEYKILRNDYANTDTNVMKFNSINEKVHVQ